MDGLRVGAPGQKSSGCYNSCKDSSWSWHIRFESGVAVVKKTGCRASLNFDVVIELFLLFIY